MAWCRRFGVIAMTLEERFWQKVVKTDACWLWAGARSGTMKYGYLHFGSKTERSPKAAHRVSWEIHRGQIPEGIWVLHRCDNPKCVNPDHLFLGNRTDNMRDAAAKGRICTIGHARLTHCKRGHEFTSDNTYRDSKGHRRCRACAQAIRNRK